MMYLKAFAIFLFLLALTSPVWAGCAWVLWVEEPAKSNHWKIAPRLHAVFDTRKDCEQEARTADRDEYVSAQELEQRFGRVFLPFPFFQCFPDTVDPRGPKAGGR